MDWSDPSRTDVVAKSSAVCATRASFSGSEHEDTAADLRVQFDLPADELTVRVSPEFTDALLSANALRPDKDEATVVDGWANRPPPAALRSVTGRRPVALPRRPEPPPSPTLDSLPRAPRIPSEFAPANVQAPLPKSARQPVPRAPRTSGLHARWLVSSAFLVVATFFVARGASDPGVRARATDTFAELRRAASARFESFTARAGDATPPGGTRPRATSRPAPRVAAARAPEAQPLSTRDPSIPVVRVEDLPLLGACEGPACSDDGPTEQRSTLEPRAPKRRPKR